MKQQNRVAFFNILSTVLLNGISLITGPLFAWLLGDSGYGVLNTYNILVSGVVVLFTLQTQDTLVNARVEYSEENQKRYQSSVMSLSMLVFLVCSAVVLTFIEPLSVLLKMEPLLIGLMLLQAFGTFCSNFLHTKYIYEFKAGRNLVISLALTLINLGLSLALVLHMSHETRYIGRAVANAATYALIGIPVCVMILLQGRTFFHREFWKFCVVLAIPAVFYNLSSLILGQSDQLMVRHMLGDAAAGHYGMAYRFGNFLFLIFTALNRTWCPFFFDEMKQGKRDAMMEKTRNYLELFTILACGFILLTPEVYHLYLYASPEYWSGTMVIPLFVTSYYLNFLCTFPVNYEYYHKKTKVVAAVTILSSLVNLGLNYLMIRAIGMAGAALATVISHALQLVIHYVYCRKLGREDYPFSLRVWAKYALGYVAILAIVYVAADSWVIRWGIGALLGIWELRRFWKRKVLI